MTERAVLERIIGVSLGGIGVIAVLTMSYLAAQGHEIPVGLSNVAIAAAAGLAGSLAIPLRHPEYRNGSHQKPPTNPSV